MARGGSRSSAPGVTHSNRTDMNQAVKVAPGGQYGSREQLAAAQHAIPLPNNVAVPQAAPAPTPPAAGPPALPGQSEFAGPSQRPGEPVTAGLPTGPGPGPEVLGPSNAPDTIGAQLRAVFAQYPNDDLLRVMALHEQGR